MSNITPTLNAYLQPRNTHCSLHPRCRASTHDGFLIEAYKIATHISSLSTYLRSIPTAYLSTAPSPAAASSRPHPHARPNHAPNPHDTATHLTNTDRDAIDTNAKLLLRDLSASLRQLSDAEHLRRTTFQTVQRKKYRRGVLALWAAGGDEGPDKNNNGNKTAEQIVEEEREETLATVRESVLWFLGRELAKVAEGQRGMVERRVRREVERGRSMLYLVKGGKGEGNDPMALDVRGGPGGVGGGGMATGKRGVEVEEDEKESRRRIEEQLTPEQLQVFASENRDMLKHYEDTLDQVRTAERSMLEISSLQSTLVQNLDIQSAHISQLVSDSASTADNVVGGNRELKRASERRSTARLVFWASCALSAVLVGWDLIF